MTRWLTVSDLAIELGLEPRIVVRLFRQGKLKGVGNASQPSSVRIVDPGPELIAEMRGDNLEHFLFITTRELAQVIGISHVAMQKRLERERRLQPSGCVMPEDAWHHGRLRRKFIRPAYFFSRTQVRQYLAAIEKRRGRDKFEYSEIIVRWLKGWLASRKTQVEVLDELIRQAANVPEPSRTMLVKDLWEMFEKIDELLRECDRQTKG